MRKLYLYMTMSLDGCVAGPHNELDWMVDSGQDPELQSDVMGILKRADAALIGYSVAKEMIPYWRGTLQNPEASAEDLAVAKEVTSKPVYILSDRQESLDWDNASLVMASSDEEIQEAVAKLRQESGGDICVPGGVRTGQNLLRLGLIDEVILMVHPVTLGDGKRLFTNRANFQLQEAKSYKSGIVKLHYTPAR